MGAAGVWAVWLLAIGAAVVCDLRTRRVPNGLVLGLLILALVVQASVPPGPSLFSWAAFGGAGVGSALLACAWVLAGGLPLWRLGLLGAGDIKFTAALAAFTGTAALAQLLALVLLCGGVLALVARLNREPALRASAGSCGDGDAAPAVRLPYTVAIAGGAVLHAGLAAAGRSIW